MEVRFRCSLWKSAGRKVFDATGKGSETTVGSEVQEEKKFGLSLDESGTVAKTTCAKKLALLDDGREEE